MWERYWRKRLKDVKKKRLRGVRVVEVAAKISMAGHRDITEITDGARRRLGWHAAREVTLRFCLALGDIACDWFCLCALSSQLLFEDDGETCYAGLREEGAGGAPNVWEWQRCCSA